MEAIGGGGAMALAEKLGWTGLSQAAPPPIGQFEDVSVFALQDLLTIVGTYTGPKDGVWSDAVRDALFAWGRDRWTLTMIPKEAGQTVSFAPQEAWLALNSAARSALAPRNGLPTWFWPAVAIGGGVVAVGLLIWLLKRPSRREE